ncbi:expressed unknown protein [Seminavis robusta]|uniref:Uncharacterized protein n=1 Tax=Seminavis robusta TaxID=568900 RepID=A0A9N8EZG2_9STRA|nr:expressed unknown protein [Seminavis robusta]|eukprot:Sro2094_g314210.1 n/a (304) ;mRNA; f:15861-16772
MISHRGIMRFLSSDNPQLLLWLLATVASIPMVHAAEIVPGLNLVPNSVACCPTIPLVGPAWKLELTRAALQTSEHQDDFQPCSFYPALSRPMVVAFQPNGNINGWGDNNACQSFQGAYQLVAQEDHGPFHFGFRWNRWKMQPFSSCTLTTNEHAFMSGRSSTSNAVQCEPSDMDQFWSRLSNGVTTLVLTGRANMELQTRTGETLVLLEALDDSYLCQALPGQDEENPEVCDPDVSIPHLGLTDNILHDYLAMGDKDGEGELREQISSRPRSSGGRHCEMSLVAKTFLVALATATTIRHIFLW